MAITNVFEKLKVNLLTTGQRSEWYYKLRKETMRLIDPSYY